MCSFFIYKPLEVFYMKTIAIIFGGKSVEHDISIITGTQAIKSAELIYNVVPIYITKEGKWLTGKKLCDISSFENFTEKHCKECFFAPNSGGLIKKGTFKNRRQRIDLCLVCLHGQNGEDGVIQGFLQQCGVAYSGCGIGASAVTFDKVFCKQIFVANGIPTPIFTHFSKECYKENPKQVLEKVYELRFPLMVKPARLGSSVGISRCLNKTQLKQAIDFALHFDNKIIVEKALSNFSEVNIAVMKDGVDLVCSSTEKICVENKMFSFEDKYLSNNIKRSYESMDKEIEEKIFNLAKQAYVACDCSGMVRIDFLIDKKGTVFVNEINSVPGSLAYYLWKKRGFGFSGLISRVIKNAELEFKKLNDLNYVLNTDAVVKFSTIKNGKMNK